MKASWSEIFGDRSGALVFGGTVFITPGKKNDAGEMVAPVLMPLQPDSASSENATSIASHKNFQFNITWS